VHTTHRDIVRDLARDVVRDVVFVVAFVGWRVVTVRVTTLRGAGAGAYYVEHLPNYYLDSGEPAGVWFGHGARALGLAGVLADEPFLAVMAGVNPNAPDHSLGGTYGEKSVRGFDVTCSAPLCRVRHNGAYAESVIMPIGVVGLAVCRLVRGGVRCWCSA
jgi:hypothetical protein